MNGWVFFFSAGFLWASIAAAEPGWSTVQKNNEAIEYLKAEDFDGGMALLAEALKNDPENAGIHLNMGVALEIAQDPQRAMKAYKLGEKYASVDLHRFVSFFNQARVLAASKNFKEALSLYQKALDLVPNSVETKINIELLVRQQQSKGKGEGEDKQKDKKDDKKDDKNKKYKQNPKPTPIPFKSKKLNKRDVKKIFEELLQQEQKIRKDEDRKSSKERPRDKDW